MMQPSVYLSLYVTAISISGVLASRYVAVPPLLFAWLWFNLFVAVYEAYIILHRRRFLLQTCPRDFWSAPVSRDFWFRAWLEYTCYSDTRYLDPEDPVFYIEGLNAVIVVLMWATILAGWLPLLPYLLVLQAANCVLYFGTLYVSRKTNMLKPTKAWLYLLLSSLWIIAPLYLVEHAR